MDNYQFAIEELALSGAVGLGQCSVSTVYRWARKINERLTTGKYSWRVKADAANRTIYKFNKE